MYASDPVVLYRTVTVPKLAADMNLSRLMRYHDSLVVELTNGHTFFTKRTERSDVRIDQYTLAAALRDAGVLSFNERDVLGWLLYEVVSSALEDKGGEEWLRAGGNAGEHKLMTSAEQIKASSIRALTHSFHMFQYFLEGSLDQSVRALLEANAERIRKLSTRIDASVTYRDEFRTQNGPVLRSLRAVMSLSRYYESTGEMTVPETELGNVGHYIGSDGGRFAAYLSFGIPRVRTTFLGMGRDLVRGAVAGAQQQTTVMAHVARNDGPGLFKRLWARRPSAPSLPSAPSMPGVPSPSNEQMRSVATVLNPYQNVALIPASMSLVALGAIREYSPFLSSFLNATFGYVLPRLPEFGVFAAYMTILRDEARARNATGRNGFDRAYRVAIYAVMRVMSSAVFTNPLVAGLFNASAVVVVVQGMLTEEMRRRFQQLSVSMQVLISLALIIVTGGEAYYVVRNGGVSMTQMLNPLHAVASYVLQGTNVSLEGFLEAFGRNGVSKTVEGLMRIIAEHILGGTLLYDVAQNTLGDPEHLRGQLHDLLDVSDAMGAQLSALERERDELTESIKDAETRLKNADERITELVAKNVVFSEKLNDRGKNEVASENYHRDRIAELRAEVASLQQSLRDYVAREADAYRKQMEREANTSSTTTSTTTSSITQPGVVVVPPPPLEIVASETTTSASRRRRRAVEEEEEEAPRVRQRRGSRSVAQPSAPPLEEMVEVAENTTSRRLSEIEKAMEAAKRKRGGASSSSSSSGGGRGSRSSVRQRRDGAQ